MTSRVDFDRALESWFETDALASAPPDDLNRALDATRRRRPLPAWLAGLNGQWIGSEAHAEPSHILRSFPRPGVRWAVLIVVLALTLLATVAIMIGARLLHPSPLPAGRLGQLAYSIDAGTYVADWDGSGAIRIASGGAEPRWSPDGEHLVYRVGDRHLVELSDPQGRRQALFPGTGGLVSWSPDSTRVSTWIEEAQTIGIYGLDGRRQALLTLPSGLRPPGDYDPVWSPDGRSVLIKLGPSSLGEVWELAVDGRPPRALPFVDPRSDARSVYSRDGSRVAFTPRDSFSLVIADADGTELRVVPGTSAEVAAAMGDEIRNENPVWSPSGELVAFVWSRGAFYDRASRPLRRDYELRVVDVESGRVTTLMRDRVDPEGNSFRPIAVSPEGDRVLFSRWEADNRPSLWSVRADGSDGRLLVAGTDQGDWQLRPAGSE